MSIFETLRQQIDLASVAARYTELTPSGARLKGCCPHPHHDDNTPSFYVYDDARFYCYGCGWHGDVVDFQAGVKDLRPGIEAARVLALDYGIDLPEADPGALKITAERRELEAKRLKQAEEAYQRLDRHPEVIEWWEHRGFGEQLRDRFLLGASQDGSAATIPFWRQGRVQGLIRRRLDGEPKYLLPNKEAFPQGYRPLFVPRAAYGEVFLVEGYVCALSAAALGLDAIAVGGTGISQHQMAELEKLPGPIYIVQDNDEEGEKAAREWARYLYPKALLCPPIRKKEEDD